MQAITTSRVLGPQGTNYIIVMFEIHWLLGGYLWKFKLATIYLKVGSSNTSCLDAHAGIFRLLMKGIFDPYVLWTFERISTVSRKPYNENNKIFYMFGWPGWEIVYPTHPLLTLLLSIFHFTVLLNKGRYFFNKK